MNQTLLAMDIEVVLGLLKAKKIQVGAVADKIGLTRVQLTTIRERVFPVHPNYGPRGCSVVRFTSVLSRKVIWSHPYGW